MRTPPMPTRGSAQDQAASRWIEHIDHAVAEVFDTMLRQPCTVIDRPDSAQNHISARIVFSGTLEGHCAIHLSAATADRLTDALLGAEGDWDDQMIDDAVGELCNMIAGGWKSRLAAPASVCHLSMPQVSRAGNAETLPHAVHEVHTTHRFYGFNDNSVLEVALTHNQQVTSETL
jgi:chemotaxis protein CheX